MHFKKRRKGNGKKRKGVRILHDRKLLNEKRGRQIWNPPHFLTMQRKYASWGRPVLQQITNMNTRRTHQRLGCAENVVEVRMNRMSSTISYTSLM